MVAEWSVGETGRPTRNIWARSSTPPNPQSTPSTSTRITSIGRRWVTQSQNLDSGGGPRSCMKRSIGWRREKINIPAISSSVTRNTQLSSKTNTTTIPWHRRESLTPPMSWVSSRWRLSGTPASQTPAQSPQQGLLCHPLPQPEVQYRAWVEVKQDPPGHPIPTITLAPTLHRQEY